MSGWALDPAITAIFADAPGELLAISAPDDPWAAVVDAEPGPRRTFLDDALLDDALQGFGDAADLKAPCFQGHSAGVARLARAAASALSAVDATLVYRAGLLHDLGRVAEPTGVWERPGPLRAEDWELVRLHPYHSGRILAGSPVLERLATVVSRHHERTDGSGYPAGASVPFADGGATAAGVWARVQSKRLGQVPLAGPGLVLPGAWGRLAERRRKALALEDFARLVATIRSGPPPGFFRIGWVRRLPSHNEFFVHHEDVRRANGRGPRTNEHAMNEALWHNVTRAPWFLARRLHGAGLELHWAGTAQTARARRGKPTVRIAGPPGELLLYLFGRQNAALVEVSGTGAAVEAVRRARFGM